jgi:hypothetical protein
VNAVDKSRAVAHFTPIARIVPRRSLTIVSHPSDSTLRAAVERAITTGSLRGVARQTGLSCGCIKGFVAGKTPFAATRCALQRWYLVDTAARARGSLAPDAAEGLLRLLVRHLPAHARERAASGMVDAIEGASRAAARPSPSWVVPCRAALRAGTDPAAVLPLPTARTAGAARSPRSAHRPSTAEKGRGTSRPRGRAPAPP